MNITDEERNGCFANIAKVVNALHKAFNPEKVDYDAYGDIANIFTST